MNLNLMNNKKKRIIHIPVDTYKEVQNVALLAPEALSM